MQASAKPIRFGLFALIAVSLFAFGCSAPKGTLFYGALAKGDPVVVFLSGVASGAQSVVAYDQTGVFMEVVADLTYDNLTPSGIAKMDAFNFMVALSGSADSLGKFSTTGGYTTFVQNANLTGTLYQMAYHQGSSSYFVIKANTIEGFDRSGNRIGNPFLAASVGACTLSTPKGIAVDSTNNRMFVTNSATGTLSVYDMSNINAPTCLRQNSTMGATSVPVPVLVHSTGYVFSATQLAASRKIWAFPADGSGTATGVYTDVAGTVLKGPTAMAEMQDATVLVANSGTKQIDRFQFNGTSAATRVGSTPFIKDTFTTQVNDILVMRGL